MSSTAQVLANRTNSLRSTGPRTEEGKAAAKHNARTHGLTSRELVLPHESREEYTALHAAFQKDYQPVTETERELVTRMADAWWRLQRACRVENAFLSKSCETASDEALAGIFLDPKESAKLRLVLRYSVQPSEPGTRLLPTLMGSAASVSAPKRTWRRRRRSPPGPASYPMRKMRVASFRSADVLQRALPGTGPRRSRLQHYDTRKVGHPLLWRLARR